MKGALLYQLHRKGRKAIFKETTWRLAIGWQQHFESFNRTCLGRIADSALPARSGSFFSGALYPCFASQQACRLMASAPEVLSDCPAAKKDQSAARKEAFLEVYKQLKHELLSDSELFSYTSDSRAWLEKMLDYNVPRGKLNRGLSVVDSFMLLKRGKEISKDEVLLASILGWCIEWMQAYFLVSDDIMDNSITRRGQPCWFRIPKVGMIAVNDGIVLRNQYIQILRTHFGNKSYYTELLRLFNEVEYQTAFGQTLDVILTPAGEVDLDKYVPQTYFRIVQYKTAYYSFYLPVSCALYLAGERSSEVFESAKAILVEMGTYFQVQDDYLDCFGTPELIGKIGTDIEDAKCSWLIVQALQHANFEQKAILKDNYGKTDHSHVSKVKEIYSELNIQKRFEDYEQESYSKLVCSIEKEGDPALQDVLKSFLLKIYRRQK